MLLLGISSSTYLLVSPSSTTNTERRDGGLPASKFFAKVHKRLDLPLNSLYLTTGLTIVFGCVFLGSSSAFSAIISASVIALGVSYGFPIGIHCIRGRDMLPAQRPFVLPGIVGWIVNLVCQFLFQYYESFQAMWKLMINRLVLHT